MLNSKTIQNLKKSLFYEQALVNLKYALHQTYTSTMLWNTLVTEIAAYLPHISWIGLWLYKNPSGLAKKPFKDLRTQTSTLHSKNDYLQLVAQVGLERENQYLSILDQTIETRAIKENRNQIISQVQNDPDYQIIDEETKSLITVILANNDNLQALLTAESHQPAAFDAKDEILFIEAGQLALAKLKEIENENRT